MTNLVIKHTKNISNLAITILIAIFINNNTLAMEHRYLENNKSSISMLMDNKDTDIIESDNIFYNKEKYNLHSNEIDKAVDNSINAEYYTKENSNNNNSSIKRKHTDDNNNKINQPNKKRKQNQAVQRLYICSYINCNKKFDSSSHFNDHKRTHTGERPFKCDYPNCDKKFVSSSNLNWHKKIHIMDKHK